LRCRTSDWCRQAANVDRDDANQRGKAGNMVSGAGRFR
jgi:hypothetical protein